MKHCTKECHIYDAETACIDCNRKIYKPSIKHDVNSLELNTYSLIKKQKQSVQQVCTNNPDLPSVATFYRYISDSRFPTLTIMDFPKIVKRRVSNRNKVTIRRDPKDKDKQTRKFHDFQQFIKQNNISNYIMLDWIPLLGKEMKVNIS